MRLAAVLAFALAALALTVPAAVGRSEGALLSVTVAGNGRVTSDDGAIDCPGACTASYTDGRNLTLTAHPASGATFAGWSGDCAGDGGCSVKMKKGRNVTATFDGGGSGGNELTVDVKGDGRVTAGGGSSGGGGGGGTPPPPLDIEIAIDTTGSMSGSIEQAQADSKTLVTDVQSKYPGALFAVVQFKDYVDDPEYQLLQPMTADPNQVNAAIDTMSAGGGGDLPEAYNLVFQRSVTDSATGWRTDSRKLVVVIGDAEPHGAGAAGFAGCEDDSEDPNGLNTATVLAAMKTNERTLIMVRQAETASASLQCYQSLAAASFDGGAAQDGGDNLISVIEDLIGGAVQPPPGGTGGGIDCPKDCSEVYFNQELVELHAEPSSGWVFAGWGGDCDGTGTCKVHMTQNRHVTATFNRRSRPTPTPTPPTQQPQTFGLSVGVTGNGSVASSPGGISCGGDCGESYPQGTKVTLVAFPGAGSSFVSWGGACSGTGVCSLTIDGNKSVQATFAAQQPPSAPIGPPTSPIGGRGVAGDLSPVEVRFDCFAPKEIFLFKLFADVLHRKVDQASLDLYFPRLANGQLTPAAAALAVLQSVEYRTQLVTGFYTALLHRPPTPAELAAALVQLAAGATDEQVEAGLLGSPGYFAARGGGTNAGFLAALYGDLLGRPPSAAEQGQFATDLANGMTLGAVALRVLTSPEARTRLIRSDFQTFLGRPPTDAELSSSLARLAAGESAEQIAASIIGSAEYVNRLPDYRASVSWSAGSSTDVDVRHVGDGTTCIVTARHRFETAGREPLTVEVTDPFGGSRTFRGFLQIVVPPPPPPGKENVQPFGTVLINVRGRFVPLTNFRQVTLGTELDTTRGRVRLTSHDGSTGFFFEGRFKILQVLDTFAGRRKPFTQLLLTGGTTDICKPRRTSGVSAQPRPPHRVIRHAWGDAHGSFKTKGRYAAATVRGTRWETIDYCDGTLVIVRRGRVDVFDLIRHVHHLVPAGRSFFVRAP
jgi:uncharacterized repeat protein (TIGR02543 family)